MTAGAGGHPAGTWVRSSDRPACEAGWGEAGPSRIAGLPRPAHAPAARPHLARRRAV